MARLAVFQRRAVLAELPAWELAAERRTSCLDEHRSEDDQSGLVPEPRALEWVVLPAREQSAARELAELPQRVPVRLAQLEEELPASSAG